MLLVVGLAVDLAWWALAHRTAGSRRERLLVGAFTLWCIVWLLAVVAIDGPARTALAWRLEAAAVLWHVLIAPLAIVIAVLWAIGSRIARPGSDPPPDSP